tara:strand:+ start:256 stop:672 length:417 start_codon:yes stop_codon:yes gene_type:complete
MNNIVEIIEDFKKYAEDIYPNSILPSKNLINDYQKEIKIKFPKDFKVFLLEISNYYNGNIFSLEITKDGNSNRELLTIAQDEWSHGMPRNWLPFAMDNSDYYCIDESGVVHFWSHDGPVDESWPNLATWIKEVWIEEG